MPDDPHAPPHLTRLFAASVTAVPDKTAVHADGVDTTYRELDGWGTAVARLLRHRGVRPGDRVIWRMHPGAEAIAALLGILKAGAVYVPLDRRNPPARNELVIADCGATAFVGDDEENPLGVPLTVSTADVVSVRDRPMPETPLPEYGADDLAYIIYTSGTTGRPKGVPVRHESVVALLRGVEELFDFTTQDRWLLFHSLAFDFSVWEIWGALSTGAALVVIPHWTARSPQESRRFIRDQAISVLNQTPTAFTVLAENAIQAGEGFPDLRYVVFGGEKLVPSALGPWVKEFGLERPRLVNMYGITETTVHATFHEIGADDLDGDRSNIGRPLPGFGVLVLDDDDEPAPPGGTGELCLCGPQLTDGYLGLPELNAERFPVLADPESGLLRPFYRSGDLVSAGPDGDLYYQGRKDLQIKLRGYRIELSEIEAVVRRHPGVSDAAVVAREFKENDVRLLCVYVARSGHAPSAPELRDHVGALLPSYMRPARYQEVSDLPRTVNGKVDRAAVASLTRSERQSQP